jgi:hypothetical protein
MVASSRTFLLFSITIYRTYITELTSLTLKIAYIHKSLEGTGCISYSTLVYEGVESYTVVLTKIWNRQKYEVHAKVYSVMDGAVKSA